MNRTCATVAAALCLSVGHLSGQVTLLTGREAKEIVALVPEVAASRARGECPTLSIGPPIGTGIFSIQARGACWSPGDPSSLLINSYTVDRKTGTVTLGASKSVVSTSEIRSKARAILGAAAARLLSVAECRCIAIEAAKTGSGPDTEGNLPSVTQLPASDNLWQAFEAVVSRGADRAASARLYYVSRETGTAWDEQAGSEVVSAGLGALRSRILALRETPALSLEDVLAVALRIPAISAKSSERCVTLEASDSNTSGDEVYLVIRNRCPGAGDTDEVAAAVNVRTGAASNPKTGAALQAPEADRLANEILSRIRDSQINERRLIDSQCRIGR
jgi:hypothetical protein